MGYLKRFAVAGIISVVFGAAIPSVTATARTIGSCWDVKPNEQGFASATNAARSKAGVRKLELDPQLSKAARMHTREMIKRNLLYHTPNDKLTHRVTNWMVLGENVGVGKDHTLFALATGIVRYGPARDDRRRVSVVVAA